jgi:hypothetical protein
MTLPSISTDLADDLVPRMILDQAIYRLLNGSPAKLSAEGPNGFRTILEFKLPECTEFKTSVYISREIEDGKSIFYLTLPDWRPAVVWRDSSDPALQKLGQKLFPDPVPANAGE